MLKYKYLSVKDIVESGNYPFTIGQLRGHVALRNKNGLCKAARKIGKHLYFRSDLFHEWVESHTLEKQCTRPDSKCI